MPGLRPSAAISSVLAILMFLGSPAWIGLLVLATLALVTSMIAATIMRADAGRRVAGLDAGDVVRAEDRDRRSTC